MIWNAVGIARATRKSVESLFLFFLFLLENSKLYAREVFNSPVFHLKLRFRAAICRSCWKSLKNVPFHLNLPFNLQFWGVQIGFQMGNDHWKAIQLIFRRGCEKNVGSTLFTQYLWLVVYQSMAMTVLLISAPIYILISIPKFKLRSEMGLLNTLQVAKWNDDSDNTSSRKRKAVMQDGLEDEDEEAESRPRSSKRTKKITTWMVGMGNSFPAITFLLFILYSCMLISWFPISSEDHVLYRVTKVVRDWILLALFLKFQNLPQLFCPICACTSRIGPTVEQPHWSQQNIVADHHGHPVLLLEYSRELIFCTSKMSSIPEVSPRLASSCFWKQPTRPKAGVWRGALSTIIKGHRCTAAIPWPIEVVVAWSMIISTTTFTIPIPPLVDMIPDADP